MVLRVESPKDFTFRTGRYIERRTKIGIADWDSDLPHHYFTKRELKDFLKNFDIISFKETSGMSERLNRIRHHYEIIAIKK